MGPRLAFSKVRDREGAIANTRGTCAPRSNSLPLLAHRDGKGLRGLRTWLPLRMWTEKRCGAENTTSADAIKTLATVEHAVPVRLRSLLRQTSAWQARQAMWLPDSVLAN